MADRRGTPSRPATESTIAAADWYGQDISAQHHERVLFTDLDLTETRSDGATFTECTFRAARFNASAHVNSAFVNCTFSGCGFFDASFTDCKLTGSVFDRCTLDMLRVAGGNWSLVSLAGADLRRAAFTGVRLRESDLSAARLEGATLRDCDLAGAWLSKAKLAKCDLRGSDISALDPAGVDLRGTIVTADQALAIASALGLDIRPD